jgi:hypothetical protein
MIYANECDIQTLPDLALAAKYAYDDESHQYPHHVDGDDAHAYETSIRSLQNKHLQLSLQWQI